MIIETKSGNEASTTHMAQLTPDIIRAAINGFENQQREIDAQISELRGMLNGNGTEQSVTSEAAPRGKRRKFSPDAIRRMREAQQRRWSKVRGELQPAKNVERTQKPKRKLSAEARARLVANLKKARAAKAMKAKAAGKRNKLAA
jgi:hypothetical protein